MMPHISALNRRTAPGLIMAFALAASLASCSAPKTEPAATATPAVESTGVAAPTPLPVTTVIAFTWFDNDQGGTVSRDWAKARDAMAALGGFRYSAIFTTMDWERTSNVMALSIWDEPADAIRGLRVAEAQLPARGWAKSGVYRRVATDGAMGDSLFRSVVMALPVTASMDSAKAIADFRATTGFMKEQPGFIASMLLERQSGNPDYGHVIVARWTSREDLQHAAQLEGFQAILKQTAIVGLPTTYLQLPY